MKVSHILVSYPLGPRTWLTAFKSATYTSTLNDLLQNPRSDVLIIYGDCDQFTGEQNYDAWSEDLKAQVSGDGKGKLEIAKIDGASHFWIDREDCKNRLLQKIVEWDS